MRRRNSESSIRGRPARAHVGRGLPGEPDALFRLAEPGDAAPLVAEEELGDVPALVLGADPHRDRHPHIVEKHLVQVVRPVDRDDRAHRDAGGSHVYEEERNPLLAFGGLRVGAHQNKAPIGHVRGRGPDLLAVDDVFVALALGGGLEGGKVRPGAGLGKTLAPPDVEIGGARQKPALLFVGAELDQHRADHRDVEDLHVGRRRELVFLEKHHALHRRPARPAMFLGPAVGGPALPVEDALPAGGIFFLRRMPQSHPLADVVGQVVGDKAAQFVAKRQLIGAEAEVHGAAPSLVAVPLSWRGGARPYQSRFRLSREIERRDASGRARAES